MENFKTLDSLISEIESSNYFKDNPHLIDKASIYRWVKIELKKFGLNIMDKKEGIIDITNYKAETPSDFGKLSLAVFCEKDYCNARGKKDTLLQSRLYVEKVEETYFRDKVYFNFVEDCNKDCLKETSITEKLYLEDGCELEFYYKNPRYVKLGRDVIRDACTNNCFNKNLKDSPYSINIKGQTVYANFRQGSLFMEYYALPIDEDGSPIIPFTQNGYLEEYLEYLIKRKILEDAIMSKDASNLITMFQYYVQKEKELFERAIVDTSPFSMKTFWDAISKQRSDNARFNLNLGKLTNNRG